MEAQLKQTQKDEETVSADDQIGAAGGAAAKDRTPTGGMILPIQKPDTELTAEAQKSRLAKAEALYGAIAEINKSTDGLDTKVNRRA